MKRRYKAGDWIRVPLGGEFDAVGIIARACRSRLFGYFFAVPSSHTPAHDELRALEAENALTCMLFGGAPLEEARWHVIAASLGFDPQRWPFPDFASRGAFGDTWTQVRYDPQTMQIVERRSIDAATASALPDARFAGAEDVETLLRRAIAGEAAPHAQSVLEVRSPVHAERLRALEHGGRIQFSTPLEETDLERVARVIEEHPQIALRVHGFRRGFDCAQLTRFTQLRELILDVHLLQHPAALRELHALRSLRVGALRTDLAFLDALPQLQRLELRGTRATLDPVLRLPSLQTLVLESTVPVDLQNLRSAGTLTALILAHGDYDVRALGALTSLRRLELRALEIEALPELRELQQLDVLELHGLTRVRDLAPIASAPALRSLRIGAMPQLNVQDFQPLQRCAGLREFFVDVASRSKEREIYRLMKGGNTLVL